MFSLHNYSLHSRSLGSCNCCDLSEVSILVLVRCERSGRKSQFRAQDVAVDGEIHLGFDVGGGYFHLVILRRERRGTGGVCIVLYRVELNGTRMT